MLGVKLQSTSVAAIVGLLICAVVYRYVKSVLTRRRHARRARELGCEEVLLVPTRDPWGFRDFIDSAKALTEKRMPELLLELQSAVNEARGYHVGTIRLTLPFAEALFTTDSANIKEMLALQFKDFELGPNRRNNFNPLLGNGIFASDGKQWEHSRAMLRPQFTRAQISDLDMEEAHVQALMDVLVKHSVPGEQWTSVVDMQVLFFRLTLDSATEFLFGESVHSQLKGLTDGQHGSGGGIDFASAFDTAQGRLALCSQLGPAYWLGHTWGFRKQCRLVHEFVDHFVQMAIKQETGEKGAVAPADDKYVFLRALAKETKDPYELRSQLLNILLAGRDTTASLLGWVFFIIAQPQNSAIFETLRRTIVEDFGTYKNPRDISFTTLKSCQYLQWCLNETLRLFPVVPINVRTPSKDVVLPSGGGPKGTSPIYVKKGQDVAYSVFLMHRREDLWGPDAAEFKPERWRGRRTGWEYLPFNGGPRICIGQQFALTEASYVVVRLLQRFDAIDGSALGPVKHGLTLTDCPGDGVNIRLRFADR